MTLFGTYQGTPTIVHKALDLKRFRISAVEVKAVPHSCIPYMRMYSLL